MALNPWRIPMEFTEHPAPHQPPYMSMDLFTWAYFSRQSIWLEARDINHKRTGIITGMSDHFRRGMRPIFSAIYKELYIGGMARVNIGLDIRAHDGELIVIGQPAIANADYIQTRGVITTLSNIVMDVVNAQPQNVEPIVVHRFRSLCDLAIHAATPQRMRDLLYLVLKNPIIFDDEDGMAFLEKAWNFYAMDRLRFAAEAPMANLDTYINLVDNTTGLYDVKMFGHGVQDVDFAPAEYLLGYTCLQFYEDAKKHFQLNNKVRFSSLLDIYDTYVAVLPNVLPISFFDMAVVFSQRTVFYAKPYWSSYEKLLEVSPKLKCC